MNRNQRRAHALLWPLVLVVLIAVCAAALLAKSRIERAAEHAAVMRTQ